MPDSNTIWQFWHQGSRSGDRRPAKDNGYEENLRLALGVSYLFDKYAKAKRRPDMRELAKIDDELLPDDEIVIEPDEIEIVTPDTEIVGPEVVVETPN
jgi:hypothetical protein